MRYKQEADQHFKNTDVWNFRLNNLPGKNLYEHCMEKVLIMLQNRLQ